MEIYAEELVRVKAYLKKDLRGMNIRQISEGLKISRNLASKYLDILTAQEEVECRVYGKSRVFFLSPRVPILDLMKYSSRLVVAVSIDQEIVQANDAFLHFAGLARDEVLHRKLSEIPSGLTNNNLISDHLHQAIAGQEINRELALSTPEGMKYYTMTLTPARFKDNTPCSILVFEDITAKKEVEAALRESEELFRVLSDSSPAGIIVYQGMQFVYVNDYMVALTGYSKEELYAMEFWQIFHPESQDCVKQRGLARQLGEEVIRRYDIRFVTKTREERWADLSAGNIMFKGKPAVVVHLMDITDRKRTEQSLIESESKFRALVEQSHDGIIIVDLDGRLLFANRRSGEIIRSDRYADMVGKANILNFLTPEFRDQAIKDFSRAVSGADPYLVRYRIRTLAEEEAWITCMGRKILYQGTTAILLNLQEISDGILSDNPENRNKDLPGRERYKANAPVRQ